MNHRISPRILVDVDDVIAAYKKTFYERTLERLPPNIHLSIEQMTSWSIVESYRKEFGNNIAEQVQLITCERGFFADLPPIPGAISALEEMLVCDYDVALVTAPLHKNPTCANEKFEWIERHLGHKWLNRTIIASEKFRVDGDVLIDDNPRASLAPKGHEPRWRQVLFVHPWNRSEAHAFPNVIEDWSDWNRVIVPLLA